MAWTASRRRVRSTPLRTTCPLPHLDPDGAHAPAPQPLLRRAAQLLRVVLLQAMVLVMTRATRIGSASVARRTSTYRTCVTPSRSRTRRLLASATTAGSTTALTATGTTSSWCRRDSFAIGTSCHGRCASSLLHYEFLVWFADCLSCVPSHCIISRLYKKRNGKVTAPILIIIGQLIFC